MACNSLSPKCVGNLPVDRAEGGQEKRKKKKKEGGGSCNSS